MATRKFRISTRAAESGRLARGKFSARISPRLPMIELLPLCTADWVNWKTKTPMHRYAMKFGTSLCPPRMRPKIT
jgi:hypothetical protein